MKLINKAILGVALLKSLTFGQFITSVESLEELAGNLRNVNNNNNNVVSVEQIDDSTTAYKFVGELDNSTSYSAGINLNNLTYFDKGPKGLDNKDSIAISLSTDDENPKKDLDIDFYSRGFANIDTDSSSYDEKTIASLESDNQIITHKTMQPRDDVLFREELFDVDCYFFNTKSGLRTPEKSKNLSSEDKVARGLFSVMLGVIPDEAIARVVNTLNYDLKNLDDGADVLFDDSDIKKYSSKHIAHLLYNCSDSSIVKRSNSKDKSEYSYMLNSNLDLNDAFSFQNLDEVVYVDRGAKGLSKNDELKVITLYGGVNEGSGEVLKSKLILIDEGLDGKLNRMKNESQIPMFNTDKRIESKYQNSSELSGSLEYIGRFLLGEIIPTGYLTK